VGRALPASWHQPRPSWVWLGFAVKLRREGVGGALADPRGREEDAMDPEPPKAAETYKELLERVPVTVLQPSPDGLEAEWEAVAERLRPYLEVVTELERLRRYEDALTLITSSAKKSDDAEWAVEEQAHVRVRSNELAGRFDGLAADPAVAADLQRILHLRQLRHQESEGG
jgi:hypothetical protein